MKHGGDRTLRRRATIQDVARAASVHPSTVSRILRAEPGSRIPPATVDRVMKAARSLGYSPNRLAVSLRTKRSMAIGVVVTDTANPTIPPLLLAIDKVLAPRGYVAVVAHLRPGHPAAADDAHKLLSRQLDGLILASSAHLPELQAICEEAHLPVASVFAEHVESDGADTYEASGIRLALEHLGGLGHRRVVHIAGPADRTTARTRARAFLAAMSALGLPLTSASIIESARYTREAGVVACEQALALSPRPTAILASHDLIALGCIETFRRRNIACPGEISVVGFDDIPNLDLMEPPLTTIRIDYADLGRQAAQFLLDAIDADSVAIAHDYKLVPELIVRGSTVAPAPAARRRKTKEVG